MNASFWIIVRLLFILVALTPLVAAPVLGQRRGAARSPASRAGATTTLGSRADGFTWEVPRGHVVRRRDTLGTGQGRLIADGWSVLPGRRLVTVQRGRLASGAPFVASGMDDLVIARWTLGLLRFPDAVLVLDSAATVGGKPGRLFRFEIPGAVGDIRVVAHRGDFYVIYSARETHDPLDPRTVAALDAFRLVD